MRDGRWQGLDASAPKFRALFTRESVIGSDWYQERLKAQQRRDVAHWQHQIQYLEKIVGKASYADIVGKLGLRERLATARFASAAAKAKDYPAKIAGTIGVDPVLAPKK
jgi:hypothetical protein